MKNFASVILCAVLTISLTACRNKQEDALKEHLLAEYTIETQDKKMSSGNKAQYINMEESINQAYVNDLDSLINTSFERQLERFADEQLGMISNYSNMISWLFSSKDSWNDKMNLYQDRYFNNLDINQEQHALYLNYSKTIGNLRKRFVASQTSPKYTTIDLPQEDVSLSALASHTRNNIVIELATEVFEWLLGFVITFVVLLFVDKLAGPAGCLIDIIVMIIIIITSYYLSSRNDAKLIQSIKEQHTSTTTFEPNKLLEELNQNTYNFYETR